jgi:hypothetical protein
MDIQPRATHDDGQFAARQNIRDCFACGFAVRRDGVRSAGVSYVYHMMRDSRKLRGRRFRGADVEPVIDLHTVRGHDFTAEPSRDIKRDAAFPNRSRSDYNQRVVWDFHSATPA